MSLRRIKVGFLINDYYINNFITVYREMKKSLRFKPVILATDYIELDKSIKNSADDVCKFLSSKNLRCINTKQKDGNYIDLKKLKLDFVFYLTPYDIYFPTEYFSDKVSEFADICHIAYGSVLINFTGMYESMNTNPFYDKCKYFFTDSDPSAFSGNISKIATPVGLVKLDDYLYYDKRKLLERKNDNTTVVWKPRWTLTDDDSNFMRYKDTVLQLIKNHPDVTFYIFFHQLFNRKVKEFGKEKEMEEYYSALNALPNYRKCDYSDFLDEVLTSDIMITDYSSTMAEFASTGKPIIYCNINSIELNDLGKRIAENCYRVSTANELVNAVESLLSGVDPLKDRREAAAGNYFCKPREKTASKEILRVLKEGYSEKRTKA